MTTSTHYDNWRYISPYFYSYGITGDAVGNGWWTLGVVDIVETVDTRTGNATELPMRPP